VPRMPAGERARRDRKNAERIHMEGKEMKSIGAAWIMGMLYVSSRKYKAIDAKLYIGGTAMDMLSVDWNPRHQRGHRL